MTPPFLFKQTAAFASPSLDGGDDDGHEHWQDARMFMQEEDHEAQADVDDDRFRQKKQQHGAKDEEKDSSSHVFVDNCFLKVRAGPCSEDAISSLIGGIDGIIKHSEYIFEEAKEAVTYVFGSGATAGLHLFEDLVTGLFEHGAKGTRGSDGHNEWREKWRKAESAAAQAEAATTTSSCHEGQQQQQFE